MSNEKDTNDTEVRAHSAHIGGTPADVQSHSEGMTGQDEVETHNLRGYSPADLPEVQAHNAKAFSPEVESHRLHGDAPAEVESHNLRIGGPSAQGPEVESHSAKCFGPIARPEVQSHVYRLMFAEQGEVSAVVVTGVPADEPEVQAHFLEVTFPEVPDAEAQYFRFDPADEAEVQAHSFRGA